MPKDGAQRRDSLIRLIYCNMLGSDVSFACIHAVKLAQQGSTLDKRVGYLACSLLMDDNHELVTLLVNTMQKDLMSTSILDNMASLTAIPYLCSSEMIPAMLPLVKEKLTHSRDPVRKRAILCMHHFLHKVPDMIHNNLGTLRRMLSDQDPSVVWATLHVFHDLIVAEPIAYHSLVPGLLGVLGQIINRRLPTEYDFHTVPSPWMTILLLRMLGRLGAQDQSASQEIYPALKEVLQKTEPTHKMGLAVIFECLQTVTQIYPYPELVDHAVSCVGRFLSAKNINLKYLGLKALASMATISPRHTVEHQEVVLDCLEHPDSTIQRQTLQLLYKMAGPNNVKVINAKLLEFLEKNDSTFLRMNIIQKIIELTEKFSTNLLWYIETLNLVIRTADNTVPENLADSMLWKISQACVSTGDETDPLTDKQLRAAVFQLYWSLLQTAVVSPTVLRVAAWVLGEFSHCVQDITPNQVLTCLLHWYQQTQDIIAKRQIVSALQKMAYYVTDASKVTSCLYGLQGGAQLDVMDRELKQRIQEFKGLCSSSQAMKIACNPETRPDISQLDFSLSFLDEFVSDSLEKGAPPYQSVRLKDFSSKAPSSSLTASNLTFDPYPSQGLTSRGSSSSRGLDPSPTGLDLPITGSVSSGGSSSKGDSGLKLKTTKKVWGKEGLIKERSAEKPQTSSDSGLSDVGRLSDALSGNPNSNSEMLKSSTAISPEQYRRNQFASALFGSLETEETDQKPPENLTTDLVNLSEDPTFGGPIEQPYSPTVEHQSTTSQVLLTGASSGLHSGKKSCGESDQEIQIEAHRTATARPDFLTSGDQTPKMDSILLGSSSIFSPEEQVLPPSMYSTFQLNDPEYKDFMDVVSDQTQNSDTVRRKTTESANRTFERDSLEIERTMYDDMQTSSLSNTPDEYIQPMLSTTVTNPTHLNDAPKTPERIPPTKVAHGESHPSPWKMLGPRRSNLDESTEESISIEVDSIEDESPPANFTVESPTFTDGNPVSISKAMGNSKCEFLKELEMLPKSDVSVILERTDLTAKCQKVFKKDCLVLILDLSQHEHLKKQTYKLGVESNTFYDIQLLSVINGVAKPAASDILEFSLPVSALVTVKPKQTQVKEAVGFRLTLPGGQEAIRFEIAVPLADFLRPGNIKVDKFGELWSSSSLRAEMMSLDVPDPSTFNTDTYTQILQDTGFQIIQRIGSEVIMASRFVATEEDLILLHCKLAGSKLLVTTKCRVHDLAKRLAQTIDNEIKR